LEVVLQEIVALSNHYQTEGVPGSCIWTQAVTAREQVDVTVIKTGKGLVVTYGPNGMKNQAMILSPAMYCVELVEGWSAGIPKTVAHLPVGAIMASRGGPETRSKEIVTL
jgi:hypothetical protein